MKEVREYANDGLSYDLDGTIDEAISKLEELKNKGWTNLEFHVGRHDDYHLIYPCKDRPENELEINKREEEADTFYHIRKAKYEELKKEFEE